MFKNKNIFAASLLMVSSVSIADELVPDGPSEVYKAYYAVLQTDYTFDDLKNYSSKLNLKMIERMEQRFKEEGTSQEILEFGRKMYKCLALDNVSEKVSGETATVIAVTKGICGDNVGHVLTTTQTMVYEGGWKVTPTVSVNGSYTIVL